MLIFSRSSEYLLQVCACGQGASVAVVRLCPLRAVDCLGLSCGYRRTASHASGLLSLSRAYDRWTLLERQSTDDGMLRRLFVETLSQLSTTAGSLNAVRFE